MTIPTLLTQGATTHIKDGLPVTTVSNLGALTQASEELIMQIKETADKALKIAEGGGGGGGGSSEELEEVKKIANEANDRSLSNKVSIDSLTTSLNATNSTLNSYISATDTRLGTIESSITATNTRLDSVEADLTSAISAANTKIDSVEASLKKDISDTNTKIDSVEESLTKDISDTNTKIDAVKADLTSSISDTNTKIDTVEATLTEDISDTNTKIDTVKADLTSAINDANTKIDSVEESLTQDISNTNTKIDNVKSELDQKVAGLETSLNTTNESLTALETKHDNSINDINALLDTAVVSELDVQQQTTGEYVVSSSSKNLKTKDTTASSWEISLASSAKAGLMPKESYQAIDDLQSRVVSLESGGIWRATFATYQALIESYPDLNVSSTDWTVNDYVEVESDSNYDGDPTRYVVVVNGEVKTLVFQKKMQAAVQIATESSTGVVLGSADTAENKYKIFVENDGSMNLIGAKDIEANLSVAVPYSSVVGESVSQYKLVEKDGLLFRANSAILEVPATFDPTAWTQVGGRDMALDEVTISKNADDKLQAIGVIEKNQGNTKYDWVGTYQEWLDQNVAEEHPEWICYITDDSTEDASDKLNTDVSNITTAGKEAVVSWGMPDYTAVVKTSSLPVLYADKNYYVKIQAATANGFDLYKGDTLIMTEIILSTGYVSSSCIVPKGYTIKFRDGDRNYNLWYCPLLA